MTRDAEHMKQTLDRVLAAWFTVPEMRLGQLLLNATLGKNTAAHGAFYTEDDELGKRLCDYAVEHVCSEAVRKANEAAREVYPDARRSCKAEEGVRDSPRAPCL